MRTLEPDPIRRQTTQPVLSRIDRRMEANVRYYAARPESLTTRRIEELDREWDMERVLQINASILALTGLLLALRRNRKFLLLTGGVLAFLLQHSIMGWCPPAPVFRRLGIRTRREIDREKFALKAIRGDFRNVPAAEEDVAIGVFAAVNR